MSSQELAPRVGEASSLHVGPASSSHVAVLPLVCSVNKALDLTKIVCKLIQYLALEDADLIRLSSLSFIARRTARRIWTSQLGTSVTHRKFRRAYLAGGRVDEDV